MSVGGFQLFMAQNSVNIQQTVDNPCHGKLTSERLLYVVHRGSSPGRWQLNQHVYVCVVYERLFM